MKLKHFWRSLHILIGLFYMCCIFYLFYAALCGPIDWMVYLCIAAIIAEGFILMVFKGCPLTKIQNKAGDQKGFFDLFLSEKALPYVVPVYSILFITALLIIYVKHF